MVQSHNPPSSVVNNDVKLSNDVEHGESNSTLSAAPGSTSSNEKNSCCCNCKCFMTCMKRNIYLLLAIIIILVVCIGVKILATEHYGISIDNIIGGNADANTTPITIDEVRRHNTPNDCWMIIHGNVYDLSKYAKNHPGGTKIIIDLAGKDATADYDAFHPTTLLRLISNDMVGTLVLDTNFGGSEDGTIVNNNENDGTKNNGNTGSTTEEPIINGITPDELALHNKPKTDCWVAIHGNVYDLTNYANNIHPPGPKSITKYAGMDCTVQYDKVHPKRYLSMVSNTIVGPYVSTGSTTTTIISNSGGDANIDNQPQQPVIEDSDD